MISNSTFFYGEFLCSSLYTVHVKRHGTERLFNCKAPRRYYHLGNNGAVPHQLLSNLSLNKLFSSLESILSSFRSNARRLNSKRLANNKLPPDNERILLWKEKSTIRLISENVFCAARNEIKKIIKICLAESCWSVEWNRRLTSICLRPGFFVKRLTKLNISMIISYVGKLGFVKFLALQNHLKIVQII